MQSKYETLKKIIDYVKNESDNPIDELLTMGFTPCQLVNEFDFDEEDVKNSEIYEELSEDLDEDIYPFLLGKYSSFDASLVNWFKLSNDSLLLLKETEHYKRMKALYEEEKEEALTEVMNQIFGDFDEIIREELGENLIEYKTEAENSRESAWVEVRCDRLDENSNTLYVDAWLTDNDDEAGIVIAKIDADANVEYLEDMAKEDPLAQEVIGEVVREVRKRLFESRIEALKKRCEDVGALFEHCFYDENHLQDFWYDGNDIATIEYKNHLISFDVCGDVIVGITKNGNNDDVLNFRHKGGGEPFFHNSELRDVIPDDEVFKKLVYDYDIVFDNNNWINIVVTDLETNEYVSEPEVADECDLLEAVENNFDFFIQYIDNLVATKSN